MATKRTKYAVGGAGRRALLAAPDCPLDEGECWRLLHGDDPRPSAHLFERWRARTDDLSEVPPLAVAFAEATTDEALAHHPHFDRGDAAVHVYYGRDDGRTWGMVFPETPDGVIPTTYRIRSVEHGALRSYLWDLKTAGGYW